MSAPPVRIAHLGLGNFFKAHQAWYTMHAADGAEWGIAAFTGRRPDAARALAPQDGLFTLVVRQPEGDELEVVTSVSAVRSSWPCSSNRHSSTRSAASEKIAKFVPAPS